MTDKHLTPLNISHSVAWKNATWSIAAVFIGLSAIFYETAANMVETWWNFETYAHGFIIIPITVWLIWDKRKHLQVLKPTPEFRGLIILIGAGFLWLLGSLINAEVVKQAALISMLVTGIWTVLGNQVTRAILFPLGFLFFMVPVGEDLVPIMMEFTASFTVGMLQITGIPVYREGLFFSIPSGNWSVVKACSGLRYLIASVTLGCVFAYITYQSLSRRVIFIVASFIVPIIANGLRAYMIVMIGHLSGMELAVGVDHLIYGWVFFGLVMFILFAIGSRWREYEEPVLPSDDLVAEGEENQVSAKVFFGASSLVLVVAVMWLILAMGINQYSKNDQPSLLSLPQGHDGWIVQHTDVWNWKPSYQGANNEVVRFYSNERAVVSVYLAQYLSQNRDSELINIKNSLIAKGDDSWRKVSTDNIEVRFGSNDIQVEQSVLSSLGVNLLVWRVYRLDNRYTTNRYIAKLLEVKSKLLFSRQDASVLIFAIEMKEPTEDAVERAEKQLQSFVNAMLSGVEQSLDRVIDDKQ